LHFWNSTQGKHALLILTYIYVLEV
jgi:hypothetical protein